VNKRSFPGTELKSTGRRKRSQHLFQIFRYFHGLQGRDVSPSGVARGYFTDEGFDAAENQAQNLTPNLFPTLDGKPGSGYVD
jgi:hypothetical protein